MKTILEAQEDMVCRKYTQCYQVLILSKLFSHSNQSLSENGICHFLLSIGHNGWAAIELKFIYSEKATKFCEIFPLLLTTVHTAKARERFRKILWPSQNV